MIGACVCAGVLLVAMAGFAVIARMGKPRAKNERHN